MRRKRNEPLKVLGQLMHNRDAVEDLERQGIFIVKSPQDAQGETLLITAHGKDPKDIARAKTIVRDVLDMTCPIVQDQHRAARSLKNEGRAIILIGMRSRSHAEVEGTVGVLDGCVVIVESVDDVNHITFNRNEQIGVIAQTTFDEEKVKKNYSENIRAVLTYEVFANDLR